MNCFFLSSELKSIEDFLGTDSVKDIGASGVEAIGPLEEVGHRIRVRLGTLVAVKGANPIHLFLGQLEVEEISIHSHASRGGALGDNLDISLQEPT